MIETLQDWNTRLGYCGCCQMPECPTPLTIYQTIQASASTRGYEGESPPGAFDLTLWKWWGDKIFTKTQTGTNTVTFTDGSTATITSEAIRISRWSWSDNASITACVSVVSPAPENTCEGSGIHTNEFRNSGGVLLVITNVTSSHIGACVWRTEFHSVDFRPDPDEEETVIIESGNPFYTPFGSVPTTPDIVTYEDGFTWAEWLAASEPRVIDALNAAVAGGAPCWGSGSTAARHLQDHPVSYGDRGSIDFEKLRFRFRIPTTHAGSKFYITYDIAEFPEDGDPSFVSEDNVVEWTGPGTGSSSDPSWLTPWVEIDPPEVPGERRIVNIRYTCYSGTKYGSKPQVMGEALEIPPP